MINSNKNIIYLNGKLKIINQKRNVLLFLKLFLNIRIKPKIPYKILKFN